MRSERTECLGPHWARVAALTCSSLLACAPPRYAPQPDAATIPDAVVVDAFEPPPPPLDRIVSIAAGGDTDETFDAARTCAVDDSRDLYCWGVGFGERPVRIDSLRGVVTSVAIGAYHICVSLEDGSARCWGRSGDVGALGTGSLSEIADDPVPVVGLTGVERVVAGLYFTCALLRDSTVRCWGANAAGQLGNGTTSHSGVPVAPIGIADVRVLRAGAGHVCVVTGTGSLQCWGYNTAGQVGDASTTDRLVPVTVTAVPDATDVALGREFTCAVRGVEGGVSCWGFNAVGQLGDGTETERLTPAPVRGLGGVTAVAAGGVHACAISRGRTWCWGYNGDAELGTSTLIERSSTPVEVTQAPEARALAADLAIFSHTCALTTAGTVFCWGSNYGGQLGGGLVGGYDYGVLVAR